MEEKRTSVFENALIWFGAGVSIAEIVTGTYLAPLGLQRGILAVLLGHLIGGGLMFLAGYIGGKTGKSAMETVAMSFGRRGGLLFSVLNIVQLIGWTAIMIYDGALAANDILSAGKWIWCAVIGGLIVLWILIGITNLGKVNTVSMSLLTVLTIILSFVIFGKTADESAVSETMSFGAAVELSAAMPLSWLPLVSDYTSKAKSPTRAAAVSVTIYIFVSSFMYIIGMGAAIFAGTGSIAEIMVKAGPGIAALLIIVLSTVTTTFLDAYSAGVSSETLSPKINGKWIAVGAAVLGTAGAIIFPMDDITDFLYLIGSVFAPMIAVQIADFYIIKKDRSQQRFDLVNLAVWALGFTAYRLLMLVDIPIGNTLPDMAFTVLICLAAHGIRLAVKRRTN